MLSRGMNSIFLPGAKEAISALTRRGYEIYIITNQAGIARGMMSEESLKEIHLRTTEEIEKAGGKIKAIYYCPHGREEDCYCRKPKSGLFFKAQRENNLNLEFAYFIGDDERDKQAGDSAGVRTILLDENYLLYDAVKNILS